MTTVERHIEGFKKLGDYLRNIDKENTQYQALFDCIQNAKHHKDHCQQVNQLFY